MDTHNTPDSYPHEDGMGAGILIFEWYHESREECIQLSYAPHEGIQFGIEVVTKHSTLHGHASETLSGATEACSVSMYMMNHFAFLSEQDDSDVEELKERIEELEEVADGEQSRRQTLEEKNRLLRTQMNSLIETSTTGYDQGNWRGMIQRPQFWRPPTNQEIREVAFHIDLHWHGNEPDSEDDVSDPSKKLVADSYLIVLEDIEFKHTQNGTKLLFMHNKTAGEYTTFIWEHDGSTVEIAQRPTMRNRDHSSEQTLWFGFDK